MDELLWLDATAQAELVRSGEVSAVELVDAAIHRIERLDGRINALILRRFGRVREEARAGGGDKPMGLATFNWQYSVTGQPAITLPLYWSGEGVPVGVQFIAAYGREDLLYRIAGQLEAACPWAHHWPPAVTPV